MESPSEPKKFRTWTYRLPCHADRSRFKGLYEDLKKRHESVIINVVTETGIKANVLIEELFEYFCSGRIEKISLECHKPELVIHLADKRRKPITLQWESGEVEGEVVELKKVLKWWFNPLQLPGVLTLSSAWLLIWLIIFIPTYLKDRNTKRMADSELAKIEETVRNKIGKDSQDAFAKVDLISAEEARKKLGHPIVTWASIAYFLAAIVIIILLFAFTPLGRCWSWLHELYERIFPSFHYDFNSLKHIQYPDKIRWWVIGSVWGLIAISYAGGVL